MPVTVRRADLHQHFWPEGLLSSLARRTGPPRLRRGDGGWWLELAGAPPELLPDADFDPTLRTGFDRVLIAPSLPLGIEALPVGEAEALLDDFHAGVLALGPPFELWSSLPLGDPSPARLLPQAAGLCLPAGALASREGLERLGPLLDAMLRVVGVDRLVHGSDRPVIEAYAAGGLGAAAEHAIVATNPERFLASGALA